jgi:glucokinase
MEDMPLKQELGGRLGGIPVAIDNDVRVAVIAEHGAGAGAGIRNMVGIWPGTGVGGGLILDGRTAPGPRLRRRDWAHHHPRGRRPVRLWRAWSP